MSELDPSNPIGTRFLFEDERLRVWEIVLEPGEEAPLHTHQLDYVTVVIEGGTVARSNADGTVDVFERQPGDIMRRREGSDTHSLKNIGTTRFRNVIFELK